MAGNSSPIARALRGIGDAQDRCLLEIRFGRGAQGGGDQQIEQALVRNGVAVASHGLARDHTAYEFVVAVAARRTAVAKAPVYRRCVKRHSLETFIANSPYRRRNPGIGENPSANFLATEVSRDFIPPCPERISPARVAALGPALGNRDGTLATNSILTVEQTACQTAAGRGRSQGGKHAERSAPFAADEQRGRNFGDARRRRGAE